MEFLLGLAQHGQNPWVQAVLLGLSTFIAEDPAIFAAATLAAADLVPVNFAFGGIFLGIVFGDLGLFAAGRFGHRLLSDKWKNSPYLGRMERFVRSYGLYAVLLSRFVPGMRFPVYTGAGIARMDGRIFAIGVCIASALWTTLVFFVFLGPGRAIYHTYEKWGWLILIGLLLFFFLLHRIIGKRLKKRFMDTSPPESEDGEGSTQKEENAEPLLCGPVDEEKFRFLPASSVFEFWHPSYFYIPIIGLYTWLCARYRSIGLPVAANPGIRMGGLIGESKQEIHDACGPIARRYMLKSFAFELRRTSSDRFLLMSGGRVYEAALHTIGAICQRIISSNRMKFPLICKPDRGQRGDGVSFLSNHRELEIRMQRIAGGLQRGASVRYIFQKKATSDCEAGVFYVRFPDREGRITSITLKAFPQIVGDGLHSLESLLKAPVLRSRMRIYAGRMDMDRVPARGEVVPLVRSGNHKQGCIFLDGESLQSEALRKAVDRICRDIPGFYFGRLDVRFPSVADLARGKNLEIVEINGAGAEATHIWDPRARILDSYASLFEHWKWVFAIGAENRKRGFVPPSGIRLLKEFRAYLKLARDYGIAD
ncbi:MAG: VTT domain-containing protein [Leptospiraceae bacterium]|nr:VTT domain-containing protein [Leptospiraceae bacterium]